MILYTASSNWHNQEHFLGNHHEQIPHDQSGWFQFSPGTPEASSNFSNPHTYSWPFPTQIQQSNFSPSNPNFPSHTLSYYQFPDTYPSPLLPIVFPNGSMIVPVFTPTTTPESCDQGRVVCETLSCASGTPTSSLYPNVINSPQSSSSQHQNIMMPQYCEQNCPSGAIQLNEFTGNSHQSNAQSNFSLHQNSLNLNRFSYQNNENTDSPPLAGAIHNQPTPFNHHETNQNINSGFSRGSPKNDSLDNFNVPLQQPFSNSFPPNFGLTDEPIPCLNSQIINGQSIQIGPVPNFAPNGMIGVQEHGHTVFTPHRSPYFHTSSLSHETLIESSISHCPVENQKNIYQDFATNSTPIFDTPPNPRLHLYPPPKESTDDESSVKSLTINAYSGFGHDSSYVPVSTQSTDVSCENDFEKLSPEIHSPLSDDRGVQLCQFDDGQAQSSTLDRPLMWEHNGDDRYNSKESSSSLQNAILKAVEKKSTLETRTYHYKILQFIRKNYANFTRHPWISNSVLNTVMKFLSRDELTRFQAVSRLHPIMITSLFASNAIVSYSSWTHIKNPFGLFFFLSCTSNNDALIRHGRRFFLEQAMHQRRYYLKKIRWILYFFYSLKDLKYLMLLSHLGELRGQININRIGNLVQILALVVECLDVSPGRRFVDTNTPFKKFAANIDQELLSQSQNDPEMLTLIDGILLQKSFEIACDSLVEKIMSLMCNLDVPGLEDLILEHLMTTNDAETVFISLIRGIGQNFYGYSKLIQYVRSIPIETLTRYIFEYCKCVKNIIFDPKLGVWLRFVFTSQDKVGSLYNLMLKLNSQSSLALPEIFSIKKGIFSNNSAAWELIECLKKNLVNYNFRDGSSFGEFLQRKNETGPNFICTIMGSLFSKKKLCSIKITNSMPCVKLSIPTLEDLCHVPTVYWPEIFGPEFKILEHGSFELPPDMKNDLLENVTLPDLDALEILLVHFASKPKSLKNFVSACRQKMEEQRG